MVSVKFIDCVPLFVLIVQASAKDEEEDELASAEEEEEELVFVCSRCSRAVMAISSLRNVSSSWRFCSAFCCSSCWIRTPSL